VIGYAQDTFTISATANYGADGPAASGSTQYSLTISAEDVLSGLQTTEGKNIRLQNEGGIIVGRVDADGNGSVDTTDLAAFAIHVNATTGELTVVQYLSIKHDDINDHDESNDPIDDPAVDDAALTQWLASGTVSLTATFTDGDGDFTTASTDCRTPSRFSSFVMPSATRTW